MSQLFISATHKSSGKTVVSIGLCAELRHRQLSVQAFKKGPDYIDSAWLAQASGQACYNLDFNTQSEQEIQDLYHKHSEAAHINLIEANKGLYDGVSLDGRDSNAALAKQLACPVILTLDCTGMTRGIAPLLQGYRQFDQDVRIAGVILNQVAGERHGAKLVAAAKEYTDIPVLGVIERNPDLEICERHLGLVTAAELAAIEQKIEAIRQALAGQVDMEYILEKIAPPQSPAPAPQAAKPSTDIKIGIFQDAAFSFYYPDDLHKFEECGAELVPINALSNKDLPQIDGLFIGGGFPEMYAEALTDNASLRSQVRAAIAQGLPCYAECGGLMYLSRAIFIEWEGKTYQMCGAIEADAVVHPRPQGRGYVAFKENSAMPWPHRSDASIRAHEFHYSRLENFTHAPQFAIDLTRGAGIQEGQDAIVQHKLVASYLHRRNSQQDPWVERFVDFVRAQRTAT